MREGLDRAPLAEIVTVPRRFIEYEAGEYYHIYNRGSGRQLIFREADNYLLVLRLLKEYSARLGITVVAYCLMPNHYHFLLRQDGEQPISLLMQRVFNAYTKAYNKRYHRSGMFLSTERVPI